MTKGILLIIGLIGGGLFIFMVILVQLYGCNQSAFFFCKDSYISIIDILRLFIPLLLLSLLTYKMRDVVYQTWFKFAQPWIVLSVFLIIITPEYGHGLIPIDKGRVSLAMSVIFLIISLIIISIKYFSAKKEIS